VKTVIPRRWWPGQQWLLSDVALAIAVVVLEIGLELHSLDMAWDRPLLVVRIPVVVAVLVLRRRLPVLAIVVAVADTVVAGQVSAVLPVAAYALTAYRPRWSVRLPILLIGSVATTVAVAPDWGIHTAVIVTGCFVLWPATLGAYVPARAQLVAATEERAERAERSQHEQARRAVFNERVRIASEMHDVVGHRVSLMVLHAGAAEMAADDPGKVRQLADQMQAAGRQALQELRQLVGLLRTEDLTQPAPLTPQPTLADIPWLLEESQLAGMDVTLRPIGQVRVVTEMVERTAYRVVQEALTNAGRHAPGGHVLVTLDYRPDALAVSVMNGPGTRAPTRVVGNGSGLIGLRERAKAAGGHLHADPQLDGGFDVEAVLPT
jgi:signal transduction histidine kinase